MKRLLPIAAILLLLAACGDPIQAPDETLGKTTDPTESKDALHVKNSGRVLPDQARLNAPPETEFTFPNPLGPTCFGTGTNVIVRYAVSDPDNPAGLRSRHLLYPLDGSTCLTQAEYEATMPLKDLADDDPRWSPWRLHLPSDPASTEIELPAMEIGTSFLLVLQAKDPRGVVSDGFPWRKSVMHGQVASGRYPLLEIRETLLETRYFVGTSAVRSFSILPGQVLDFSLAAFAEDYAGVIDGYRWGWDIVDPDDPNDPGWAVAWGDDHDPAPRSYVQGTHTFVAATRDNSGALTRVVYQLLIFTAD